VPTSNGEGREGDGKRKEGDGRREGEKGKGREGRGGYSKLDPPSYENLAPRLSSSTIYCFFGV